MRLEARAISKRFGRTLALDEVSVTLEPGRIHAFAGENGAGKSTLLKILAGAERRDSGTLLLDGAPFSPAGLNDAERRGVALVFQELTINPSLSIAENIYIDRLRNFARRGGWIDRPRLEAAAQAMLDEIGVGISVHQDLHALDLGQWKCLEICRALSNRPSTLFLDESTAFLGHDEVDLVLAVMRRLREQGLTIAFVSHHLNEVRQAADTVFVLKDGSLVATFAAEDVTADRVHAAMVGRAAAESIYPPKPAAVSVEPVLEVSALTLSGAAAPVDFRLHRGEILGLAGLKSSGGEELVRTLIADLAPRSAGLALEGRAYAPRGPRDAWRAGIAYLPGSRTVEGLILDFPVLDNVVMAALPRRGPFYRRRVARKRAQEAVGRLAVRPPDVSLTCRSLSGGNMQKVCLGKCLMPRPSVLLLNNPTRGVDVGAREEIYRIIRALVAGGTSILLLSEDLPELLGLSDRLLVMRRGTITRRFDVGETPSETDVVRHMV